MYNEVTRPKSLPIQYHENTNTYAVTARPVAGLRTKSVPYIKNSKRKSKTRKNK